MLVGEVMQVDHLGLRRAQDCREILDDGHLARILDLGTREAQLDLRGVLADVRRLALLDQPHPLHFFVGVLP